jgi:hypothetical protein
MKLVAGSLLWGASLVFFMVAATAQTFHVDGAVELAGDVAHPTELSGITTWRDLIIVCPDEGAEFNVFKNVGSRYKLATKINLLAPNDDEIDMEGAASDAEYVYIVGSHSMRRKKIDEEGTYKKNRKQLTRVTPHEKSYSLYRIKLTDDGELVSKEQVDLRYVLAADDTIRSFFMVPGKENGVDIEGVAVKDGTVFVGFRGPVLRGNFVPVLAFQFDKPNDYELRFVQLSGRGIRDITAVQDGFLIIAGPVGDGDASYKLYFWNGEDRVPDEGESSGRLTAIGEIVTDMGVKPEGIVVTAETADAWRVLVVSDGESNASEWVVPKTPISASRRQAQTP